MAMTLLGAAIEVAITEQKMKKEIRDLKSDTDVSSNKNYVSEAQREYDRQQSMKYLRRKTEQQNIKAKDERFRQECKRNGDLYTYNKRAYSTEKEKSIIEKIDNIKGDDDERREKIKAFLDENNLISDSNIVFDEYDVVFRDELIRRCSWAYADKKDEDIIKNIMQFKKDFESHKSRVPGKIKEYLIELGMWKNGDYYFEGVSQYIEYKVRRIFEPYIKSDISTAYKRNIVANNGDSKNINEGDCVKKEETINGRESIKEENITEYSARIDGKSSNGLVPQGNRFIRGAMGDKDILHIIDEAIDKVQKINDINSQGDFIGLLEYMGFWKDGGFDHGSCSPFLENALKERFDFLKKQ